MGILARRLLCWIAPFLGSIWVPALAVAAQMKELDLVLTPPGTVATRPARPGDYSFVLKNTMSGKSYAVTVERELVPIAALVSPFATEMRSQGQPPDKIPDPCGQLIADFEAAVEAAS